MNSLPRLLIVLHIIFLVVISNISFAQVHKIYVGTYTSKSESQGVYVYDFDEKTGEASLVNTIPMSNPSFLARRENILYAVNEDEQGMVTAYDLDANKVISHVSSQGQHPCHISLSPTDPLAIVSNYSSGSLTAFSLNTDGSLNSAVDHISFNGSSVNKERQSRSHIHSAFFSKDGKKVYVSDLGADLIYIFEIQNVNGTYKLRKSGEIKTKLGGGPRHLTFSKDEKMLYSVLELTGEIEVFEKNQNFWQSKQVIRIYSNDFAGNQGAADIKISSNGKYIYATNRGDANVLVSYKLTKSGMLKVHKVESTQGVSPRNVNLSPSEKFVLISNQLSNNITILDSKTKKSKNHHINLKNYKPVCVVF